MRSPGEVCYRPTRRSTPLTTHLHEGPTSDMTDEIIDQGPERSGINRRTVMKGAAWTVPVIMVASAAPAMASSPPVIIDFGSSGACKIPGESYGGLCYNKGYVLWANFVNDSAIDYYISVTGMVVGGVTQCIVGISDPLAAAPCPPTNLSCVLVPANSSKVYGVFSNAASDSANTDVTVSIAWWTTAGCAGPASGTATLPTGFLSGNPWTGVNPGGQPTGSCVFPAGMSCFEALPACGTACAS